MEWNSEAGPVNEAVEEIVKAARSIIRGAEETESRVGGVLRYVVIREEFEVTKGFVYNLINHE